MRSTARLSSTPLMPITPSNANMSGIRSEKAVLKSMKPSPSLPASISAATAAIKRTLRIRLPAEREDFDTGEGGVGAAQILSFLARDFGYRAQENGCRNR